MHDYFADNHATHLHNMTVISDSSSRGEGANLMLDRIIHAEDAGKNGRIPGRHGNRQDLFGRELVVCTLIDRATPSCNIEGD
jgi:hypothetical protein